MQTVNSARGTGRRGEAGFSLIELMVGLGVTLVFAAFAVPATTTILRGSQLQQGSQILVDQLSLARQYALSKNHPVEVRLIRFADPEVPGEVDASGVSTPAKGNYRAIQIMETLDTIDPTNNDFVRLPLDKPQVLPQSIVMSKGAFSTLIPENPQAPPNMPAQSTASSRDPVLPRKIGNSYDFMWFRFLPDGSTNLPAQSTLDADGAWCITLYNINDPPATLPKNFFTLQIDPVSGAIKQFRPGLPPSP